MPPWEKYAAPAPAPAGPWSKYGAEQTSPQPERRGDAFDAARDIAWQLPQGFNRGLDATINAPYNLIRGGAGLLGYEIPEAQPIFARANSGVEPEGASGRIAGAVGESIGSSVIPSAGVYGMAARTATPLAANAGTLARTGNALLEGVRAAPKTAAAMDLASATGSGVGVGIARENDLGPWGELALGFAGGMLPIAGAIGKSAMQLSPTKQLTQNELLDAGQRQGVPIPRAVQGGDVTRAASAGLKEIPFVGTPIQQGYDDAVQKLGERAAQVAAGVGSGNRYSAGQQASDALRNWIKGESKDISSELYGEVDALMRRAETQAGRRMPQGGASAPPVQTAPGVDAGDATKLLSAPEETLPAGIGPNIRHGTRSRRIFGETINDAPQGASAQADAGRSNLKRPLNATRSLVRKLRLEQFVSATTQNNKAIDLVREALGRTDGLTYEGVKNLRTVIGQYLSGSILPEAGTPMPALKRLYGALTDDLRATVEQVGGRPALIAFDRANKAASIIAKRREQIAKVIGQDGMVSPERVFDSVYRMASEKGGGDLRRLAIVRQAVGDEAWKEVQSTAIARLGRNAKGDFSPAMFETAWNKLSDGGKAALFGRSGDLRQSLDDITTIARQFDRMSRLGNPSGTGRVNSLWQILGRVGEAAAGVAIYHKPEAAIALAPIVAGRGLSKYLGNPTTATAVRQFSKAYANQIRANSTAGRAALNSAVRGLAQAVAQVDGSDPAQVEAEISKAVGDGQPKGPTEVTITRPAHWPQ